MAEANGLIHLHPTDVNLLLATSHIKYSFHVFDHAIKTFERDKLLGFAWTFITLEGVSESMDGRGCAILALELVLKNLIFA